MQTEEPYIGAFDATKHRSISKRLTELFDVWDDLRPSDGLPGRTDFDPMQVPHLLPFIFIDEVHRRPLRFRFRLVGTEIAEAVGFNPTGKFRDEIENAPTALERLKLVCDLRAPVIATNMTYNLDDKFYSNYTCLHLPFSHKTKDVDIIISISNMSRISGVLPYS